jgi:hypothetical protein
LGGEGCAPVLPADLWRSNGTLFSSGLAHKGKAVPKMKAPEMIEGTEAWTRFQTAMKKVLTVPHSEIQKRIQEHRKQAALNPNRRGPKRKIKPSPSAGPAA